MQKSVVPPSGKMLVITRLREDADIQKNGSLLKIEVCEIPRSRKTSIPTKSIPCQFCMLAEDLHDPRGIDLGIPETPQKPVPAVVYTFPWSERHARQEFAKKKKQKGSLEIPLGAEQGSPRCSRCWQRFLRRVMLDVTDSKIHDETTSIFTIQSSIAAVLLPLTIPV